MNRKKALCVIALAAAASANALAESEQEQPSTGAGEVIVIVGAAPRAGAGDLVSEPAQARAARRALGEAPFLTVIALDERAGERATVAESIGAVVGTQLRSLGGLGAFSSISIRGHSPGHTAVFLDGVPVSKLASVSPDMSRLEIDELAAIEVYRGGAPIELGGAGLGGAINLVSPLGPGPRGERWRVMAGAGSFGARLARVAWGEAWDRTRANVAVGYAGADGDFRYFDDGGTNLTARDDRWQTRRNNAYDHVDLHLRGGREGNAWSARAGLRGQWKEQGLPGTGWDQSTDSSLSTVGGVADASAQALLRGGFSAESTLYLLGEQQRFRDLAAEIGIGAQHRRYRSAAVGGGVTGRWAGGRHRLALALEGRGEWFRDRDLLGDAPRVRGNRQAGAVSIGDELAVTEWLEVAPSLRVESVRTAPVGNASSPGMMAYPIRVETVPSPRLASRAMLRDDLAIKGSAGRYARLPTAIELFGDRGFIVGSPDLLAETGLAIDGGAVWAPDRRLGPLDRIFVETAAFASWPKHTIAMVNTGGLVARPMNVGDARIRGVEATASLRLARTITVAGNYTWTDPRQQSRQSSYLGKQLPGRPRHVGYGRVDVARRIGGRLAVVWSDVSWASGTFLDRANLAPVPRRVLLGAGAKLELGAGFTAIVDLKNLGDQRVEQVALDPPPSPELSSVPRAIADVGGYPLPGRSLFFTLEWIR